MFFMQKQPKPVGNFFSAKSLLAILIVSLLINACNEKKGSKSSVVGAGEPFKMKCLVLTKAQVQVWKDSGWFTGSNQIRQLAILFSADEANHIHTGMGLTVYPGNTVTNVRMNGKTKLSYDTSCATMTIVGEAVFGNNAMNINELGIIDSAGNLTNFSFIRFKPKQVYAPFINFDVQVVGDGGVVLKELVDYTKPCPPYCPPPPEEQ
jgi:hypothetical protein